MYTFGKIFEMRVQAVASITIIRAKLSHRATMR